LTEIDLFRANINKPRARLSNNICARISFMRADFALQQSKIATLHMRTRTVRARSGNRISKVSRANPSGVKVKKPRFIRHRRFYCQPEFSAA
jgi:hypothetical protein